MAVLPVVVASAEPRPAAEDMARPLVVAATADLPVAATADLRVAVSVVPLLPASAGATRALPSNGKTSRFQSRRESSARFAT